MFAKTRASHPAESHREAQRGQFQVSFCLVCKSSKRPRRSTFFFVWLFSKSTNQQGRSSASHQKRINKAKVSSSENDQKQINDVKVLVGSSANNEKERNSPIQLVFIEDEKEFSAFHMFSFQYTFSAHLKD